jgi:hypothetical protein
MRFSTATLARLCCLLLATQHDAVNRVAEEHEPSWDIRTDRSSVPAWTAAEDLNVRSLAPSICETVRCEPNWLTRDSRWSSRR